MCSLSAALILIFFLNQKALKKFELDFTTINEIKKKKKSICWKSVKQLRRIYQPRSPSQSWRPSRAKLTEER